jgi:hypothetical protein
MTLSFVIGKISDVISIRYHSNIEIVECKAGDKNNHRERGR